MLAGSNSSSLPTELRVAMSLISDKSAQNCALDCYQELRGLAELYRRLPKKGPKLRQVVKHTADSSLNKLAAFEKNQGVSSAIMALSAFFLSTLVD